jgi:hypothetical protein
MASAGDLSRPLAAPNVTVLLLVKMLFSDGSRTAQPPAGTSPGSRQATQAYWHIRSAIGRAPRRAGL